MNIELKRAAAKAKRKADGGVPLDKIRGFLRERWPHALILVDAIEARAAEDPEYAAQLELWLCGEASTVHLRDNIAGPLRLLPHIIEIGKQFNPTTEWDNTWVPLDTAMHNARNQ